MKGEERRKIIAERIGCEPLSATALAEYFGVSRQVIVQDVALLRAEGARILSTNRGYVAEKNRPSRVFKTRHGDEDTIEELYSIVDLGGCVEDVFVHHKAYGTIRADMQIDSRRKADAFMEKIKSGKSVFLKKVTSDYHYHTVTAESEKVLAEIESALRRRGFLIDRAAAVKDSENESER